MQWIGPITVNALKRALAFTAGRQHHPRYSTALGAQGLIDRHSKNISRS
jgi:hypothetical protein